MGGDLRSPPGQEKGGGGSYGKGQGGEGDRAAACSSSGIAGFYSELDLAAVNSSAGSRGVFETHEKKFGRSEAVDKGVGGAFPGGQSSQVDISVAAGGAASVDPDGCIAGPNPRCGSSKSLLETIGAEPFIPSHVRSSSGVGANADRTMLSSVVPSSSDGMEVEPGESCSGCMPFEGSVTEVQASLPAVRLNANSEDGGMDIDTAAGQRNFGNSNSLLSSGVTGERDYLGMWTNAGHSMVLEAAGHGPNGTGNVNSPQCTSGVCLNAALRTAGLEQQNSAQAKGFSANAWSMPRFVKFQNVDVAIAAAKEGRSVVLDRDAVHANRMKLEGALVGKLMGRRLPFSFLNSELRKRWDRFGNFQVITVSPDCFVCIFDKHGASDEVMLGGPWIIAGQIIGLDKWNPSFSPSSLNGLKSPIWIRLPFLPLLYWDEESLGRIAAKFGEPLGMDAQTSRWGRNSFARVCVRMDLSQQLPKGVWIDGGEGEFFQQAEYEGISLLCSKCGRIGHRGDNCVACKKGVQMAASLHTGPTILSKPVASPPPPASMNSAEQPSPSQKNNIAMEVSPTDQLNDRMHAGADDPDPGDWILVTRRRNKPNQRATKAGKDISLMPSASTPLQQMAVPPPPPPDKDSSIGTSHPLQLLDSPVSLSPPSKGTQALGNPAGFTSMDARLNRKGSSSKGKSSRERVSKAHFMKELSQLGPIAMKTRKKRKNVFDVLNGEDHEAH